MTLYSGALQWPTLPLTVPTGTDATIWAQAVSGAVDWLWSKTARRFGYRAARYRPSGLSWTRGYLDAVTRLQPIYAPLIGQAWPYLGDPRQNYWLADRVLEMPGPVLDPTSGDFPVAVEITGSDGVSAVLDPNTYRLDGNFLIRVDGDPWPVTQDLVANLDQPNTWQVSYSRGVLPPIAAQVAAYLLAVEWVKLITGDKSCKLPWNTTNVSRGGVSVQLQIAQAFRTSGVPLVDRWVEEVNPGGLQEAPRVWTPDLVRQAAPYAGSNLPYRVGF